MAEFAERPLKAAHTPLKGIAVSGPVFDGIRGAADLSAGAAPR